MKLGHIEVDSDALRSVCERWNITKLEAFGSVLRDDFGPDSDVDVMVSFREGFKVGLVELVQMEGDFEGLLHRKVDLVEPRNLKWVIRDRVIQEAVLVYAA